MGKRSLSDEDVNAIAAALNHKLKTEVQLPMMTRMGIAVGGFTASTVEIVRAVPVVGHVIDGACDFSRGVGMGYSLKTEEIKREKAAALARVQQAQPAQVEQTGYVQVPTAMKPAAG